MVPATLAVVLVSRPGAGQVPQAPAAVAPVRTINHLPFRVADPRKSFEFYMKLFGGHLIGTSPKDAGCWRMDQPAAGQPTVAVPPGEPGPSMEANLQFVTSTDDGWLAAATKEP